MILTELRHFATVVSGYTYDPRGLICPNGHVRHWLSPWDTGFFDRHGFTRCWHDYKPMRPVPRPADKAGT